MANVQSTLDPVTYLLQLPAGLDRHADFAQVVAALRARRPATLDGVWGSSRALVAAALSRHAAPAPVVVVLARQGELDDFVDDLRLFAPHQPTLFPAIEAVQGDRLLQDENYGQRIRTLKQLLHEPAPPVLITCIPALLQPNPEPHLLRQSSRRLQVGQTLDTAQLSRWLVEHGYHATTAVELPGEFSVRGGLVDLFAYDWLQPVRIELFGDEIESLRQFQISSQRSLEQLDTVELTVPQQAAGQPGQLIDYLPPDSWFLLIEPDELQAEARHFLERQEDLTQCHSLPTVWAGLHQFACVTAAGLAASSDAVTARLQIESVERFSGDISRVRQELDQVGGEDEVFVIAETQAEAQRLQELFASTELARQGRLHLPLGRLRHGFRLSREQVLLISGNEIFHRAPLRRISQRPQGKAIETFLELREGDLVVHLAHGIGRYRGLRLLTKDDQVEEHLELEFHGGTKIFVPATKIDLVQKYVGGRTARPRLATIGGKNWVRQKKAAAAAVQDLAAEMLQLQAERASLPGIAFGPETEWQHEFDASFPYTETADQLVAMEAIKSDMRAPQPMDRLICGDVGFGKTELAMRAAFKAVDNGYQVAVLVPTTILAEQHYRTFCERMAEFPFSIAKLSRFSPRGEQRKVLKQLAEGSIDIVVGTHRLASKDVQFQNLGLLIIDEEQRFGVEVKDRLKTMRTAVDVLTLSATPIPRTLHMSLTGIRDISNLETPPEDRLAVETRVTRWSDELIRSAVLRELNRNGQIFFVHNRVQDIEAVAQRLQRIVPEASIGIGHGQMAEGQLERVMVDFVQHRFDLLLATTIVESGLDIPNANTIFIDDADRYGLADLHQLRGRVGRYKHRAYCYLLVDPRKSLTPSAARRLRAIEEFSDMGAGFSIAMRDLEIRGAGNLLGTQQSGHIALVGYELYCQLLEGAIRRLKNLPPELSAEVNIELPGEAYIPREYVPDMRSKIDLYRRLTRARGDEAIGQLREELLDRFGPPPPPVERLLALAALQTEAAIWQIDAIHLERPYLVFTYRDRSRAEQLVRNSRGQLRIVDHRHLYLTLPAEVHEPDSILKLAKSLLRSA